ncbi:MAG: transcription antitermination factor NusB [Aestuariivirgaceae bacterium]
MTGKPSSGRRAVARTSARLGAVQALYQMELAETGVSDVLAEYASSRQGNAFEDGQHGEADKTFLEDIVQGVVAHQRDIDRAVADCLSAGWTLARLDATLRAILRSAGYELAYRADIPGRVVLTEYVELTRAFFDDTESAFVNGALDALAHKCRPDEFAG